MSTTPASPPAKRKRGRPRSFEATQVLDRSMNVFWRRGYGDVTTRDLEREIGISQSSIYNAFGSKEGLFNQVLDRYQQQLGAAVLTTLDRPDPDHRALLAFVEAVVTWVGDPDHPGCLILNYGTESTDGRDLLVTYRARLGELIGPAVRAFTADEHAARRRTDLVKAAVLGICASARGGADAEELGLLGDGLAQQIREWQADPV